MKKLLDELKTKNIDSTTEKYVKFNVDHNDHNVEVVMKYVGDSLIKYEVESVNSYITMSNKDDRFDKFIDIFEAINGIMTQEVKTIKDERLFSARMYNKYISYFNITPLEALSAETESEGKELCIEIMSKNGEEIPYVFGEDMLETKYGLDNTRPYFTKHFI